MRASSGSLETGAAIVRKPIGDRLSAHLGFLLTVTLRSTKFRGMKTIADAVGAAGGQVALAKLLGVNPSLISQWVTGRLKVAARHCLAIEAATGVSRHELRPDVFGPAPEGEAA